MENFIDISNRLKTALSVSMDKDIAEILGISKYSFAERKKRNSFPEKELEILAAKRPELNLDVEYILTGYSVREEELEKERLRNWDLMVKGYRLLKQEENLLQDDDHTFDAELPPTPKNANTRVLLNQDEMMLISCYRKSSDESKKKIFDIAKMARDLWLAKLRLEEYKNEK